MEYIAAPAEGLHGAPPAEASEGKKSGKRLNMMKTMELEMGEDRPAGTAADARASRDMQSGMPPPRESVVRELDAAVVLEEVEKPLPRGKATASNNGKRLVMMQTTELEVGLVTPSGTAAQAQAAAEARAAAADADAAPAPRESQTMELYCPPTTGMPAPVFHVGGGGAAASASKPRSDSKQDVATSVAAPPVVGAMLPTSEEDNSPKADRGPVRASDVDYYR